MAKMTTSTTHWCFIYSLGSEVASRSTSSPRSRDRSNVEENHGSHGRPSGYHDCRIELRVR
jgi:hypothetical protein